MNILNDAHTLATLKRLLDQQTFGSEESRALAHAMALFQVRIQDRAPIVLQPAKDELVAELVPLDERRGFESRPAPLPARAWQGLEFAA